VVPVRLRSIGLSFMGSSNQFIMNEARGGVDPARIDCRIMWGRWDLNPDQRVSTTRGATPRELTGHRSSYSSSVSKPVYNHTQLTGAREDAVLPHTPMVIYTLRIFCARFRRRIFFLRHFHRCLPRFFHAREPRFILMTPRVSCRHYVGTYQPFDSVAGPSGISPSFEGFEPETSGLLPSQLI
jgi:hypothetical protein